MTVLARPIVIWGAGAIGGTIGAYLARAGEDVLFVDTVAEHVDVINADGLVIEGPIETFTVPARAVTPDRLVGRYGSVILCTKAQATETACRALAPFLEDDGFVLSLQNGLNELAIAKIVGEERTVGAFINFGADYLEPGRILFGGRGAVVLGELDGARSPRIEALHSLLLEFDKDAIITDNIWGYLWGKLGYGALLFATALTDDSIADVLAMQAYRPVLTALARELTAVADAKEITPLGFNGYDPTAFRAGAAAEATTASFEAMVAHNAKSAKTHSGIWRDLAVRKRRTEVDPQLTTPVAEGEAIGVAMPLTRQLIALIQDIERGERALSLTNLDLMREAHEARA